MSMIRSRYDLLYYLQSHPPRPMIPFGGTVDNQYNFLSNFHPASFVSNPRSPLSYEFKSSEEYYMLHKAMRHGDIDTVTKMIAASGNPAKHKRLGKHIKNFDKTMWDTYKEKDMFDGLWLKFTQNHELKNQLLRTEHAVLVEVSLHDLYWGVGLDPSDTGWSDPFNWHGQNRLGFLLMDVRTQLRQLSK